MPRAPGATSWERFFDGDDRREEPILPDPYEGARQYTQEVRIAPDASPIGGARLKIFLVWKKSNRKGKDGMWARKAELHPLERDNLKYNWATFHTSRSLNGIANNAKIAALEEQHASSDSACCVGCGARPGDEYRAGILLSPRCFMHDHVYDWEPTWLRGHKLADFRRQIKDGEAQWLCFVCNDIKTNETKGQGDTTSHKSREAAQRNLSEHGDKLQGAVKRTKRK